MNTLFLLPDLSNKYVDTWLIDDVDHDLNHDGQIDDIDSVLYLESLPHGFFELFGETTPILNVNN